MSYTDSITYTASRTLYAVPEPIPSPHGTGAISPTESPAGLYTFEGLSDGVTYHVFEQLGGSPADTDSHISYLIAPSGEGDSDMTTSITGTLASAASNTRSISVTLANDATWREAKGGVLTIDGSARFANILDATGSGQSVTLILDREISASQASALTIRVDPTRNLTDADIV